MPRCLLPVAICCTLLIAGIPTHTFGVRYLFCIAVDTPRLRVGTRLLAVYCARRSTWFHSIWMLLFTAQRAAGFLRADGYAAARQPLPSTRAEVYCLDAGHAYQRFFPRFWFFSRYTAAPLPCQPHQKLVRSASLIPRIPFTHSILDTFALGLNATFITNSCPRCPYLPGSGYALLKELDRATVHHTSSPYHAVAFA